MNNENRHQRLKELFDEWYDDFNVVSEKLTSLLKIRRTIINEALLSTEGAEQLNALGLKAAERRLYEIWVQAMDIVLAEIPNEIVNPAGPMDAADREVLIEMMNQCGTSREKLAGLRVKMPDGELLPFWHAWKKLGF